jgi:cytochrome c oxidase subunit II
MNIFLLQSSLWSPFMPPANSVNSGNVDNLYGFIFWLSVILFILVIGPGFYFVWKYRVKQGEEAKPTPRITHHLGLELTWSIIPSILCLIIAVWGFWDFMALGVAPSDADEIYVTGTKWVWNFEHKDGTKEVNELHIPEGKTYKLIMTSQDVIHSFFIPDFRVKHDLPPGRYTSIWFTPIGTGTHQIYCTEYCGDGHSGMLAKLFVMPKKEFDQWQVAGPQPPEGKSMAEWGKELYNTKSCATCHSIDGSTMTGPSLKGIFGTPQPLADGTSVVADENYVKESVLNPQAKIVRGFNPVMPSYQGVLKQTEQTAIIEFIKSLK